VPSGFSRERVASERFARAVDDPSDDGDFAGDLAVIDSLRALGVAGSPDEETRRRIRAEIVEYFVAAGEDEGEPVQDRRHRALAGLLAAVATVLLTVAGLSMVLSKDALPGDPLYSVKRAGESATLGLTFGQQAKAEKHLEFAGNRIDELAGLKMSDRDSGDYLTGLADFSSDARAGVAQLIALATRSGDRQQLAELRTWAEQRARRLDTEQPAIPSAAASRFAGAQSLLIAIQTRATALTDRLECYQITSGSSDELGALPAQSPCEPEPTNRTDVPPAAHAPELSQPDGSPAQNPVSTASRSSSPTPTSDARPTGPLPPVSSGPLAPPVVAPPILRTTGPRLPSLPQPSSPLVSIPPLLPGLPEILIP
jgi:hypothetical protein